MADVRQAAIAAAIIAVVAASPARADVDRMLGSQLRVEGATATSGQRGGRSIVRFRLINESPTPVTLLSVKSPVAERAELIVDVGSGRTATLESLTIPASGETDLTTSHLRYVLHPLTRDLVAGEQFTITLHSVGWSVPVDVHVH